MARQKTTAKNIEVAEREKIAMQMRLGGATYEQIAKKLDVSTAAAYKIISRVIKRNRDAADESCEQVKEVELARLDVLTQRMMQEIIDKKGDAMAATDRVLRIMQRRAALLGLDAATKTDVTSNGEKIETLRPSEIAARVAALMQLTEK